MMRKSLAIGAAIVLCAAPITAGSPASADSTATPGQVTVFSTELQELDTWENPEGCQKLPIAAHVLINQTDKPVNTYGDPMCMVPNLTVQPEHGAHVAPGTGSFSVGA
jgi:hypothetical protein